MKYFTPAILLLLLACSPTKNISEEVTKWEEQAKSITIIRDDYGVPHIYGKTDADAVFGLLYAQCEDDFNRVERNYIWATGRLAEVEGESALYSDLRANLFMTEEEAIERYESSPEWLKKLCVAFADGINYYLHTHPEVKPKLLTRFEPWMPMYFSEGSIGGDIERIDTEKIKALYGNNESIASLHQSGLLGEDPYNDPPGSNGFAISGKLSESGNAMLMINPHTSFYFRGEFHAVSEEGLNAYGAITWGQFFIYQGFNEKTGWMHTSTYTDVIDEFVEIVEKKENKYVYKYGDEWRDVQEQDIILKYLDSGSMKERTFTIYRTHHGPVTHKIDDNWVSTAMMWEPVKALQQSYIRTKQDGHDSFREMMNIRTNSSNNTVYADAEGNIAYYHGNFIPKRDIQFDYSKPVDGSNPQTDWQGLHEVEESIVVINPENGWIQNCNSTPFTSAAEFSPKVEDYPYYMSRNEERFRGVHAIDLLKRVDKLSLDGLIQLAHDTHLPAFETLLPKLVKAFEDNRDEYKDLTDAIEVLRNWDYRSDVGSVAMTLSHFYGLQCLRNGSAPDGLSRMERITYYGTEERPEELLSFFREIKDQLVEDFGTWEVEWGEVNRFQRINNDIKPSFDDSQPSLPVGMANGLWGALASYGANKFDTKKLYGTYGNSFVAAVEFGEKVRAKSMLAGGQSGDIDSPHFFDQAQRYIDIEFKEVAFYREDVEKRAEETYTPGKRDQP